MIIFNIKKTFVWIIKMFMILLLVYWLATTEPPPPTSLFLKEIENKWLLIEKGKNTQSKYVFFFKNNVSYSNHKHLTIDHLLKRPELCVFHQNILFLDQCIIWFSMLIDVCSLKCKQWVSTSIVFQDTKKNVEGQTDNVNYRADV